MTLSQFIRAVISLIAKNSTDMKQEQKISSKRDLNSYPFLSMWSLVLDYGCYSSSATKAVVISKKLK